MSSLSNSGVRAFKWSALSTAARFVLQFLAQVVLARLLGPENYGIFGIGMVVYTFSNFLVGFGFGWSLLQRETLTDQDIRFAFTWQLIAGCVAMLGLYFAAPWLSVYFRDLRVQPVIEWMSLACLMNAVTSPASNLLQRDLNFKTLGFIQVGSYAIGYLIVGIPMAFMGHGVYSLVAAWLTQAASAMILSYAVKRHPVKLLFWYADSKSAFGVGGAVFLTNIVNWTLNNLDRVSIGRLLNPQAIGLYTAGYNIATMPNTLLLGALQPAFMAAASKMQSDPKRLGRAYLQMLATTWVLILPFFVFLALISGDLVQLLYGPKWTQTASVMAVLFLGMPAYVTWGVSTPVLWNTGRKRHEFLLQLPLLFIGAFGFFLCAKQGILAAAVVASVLLLLRAVVVAASAFRAVGLQLIDLLPHVLRGLLLCGLPVFGVFSAQHLAASWAIPLATISLSGFLTLVLLIILIKIYPQLFGVEATGMVIKFAPRLRAVLKHKSLQDDSLN